MFGFSHFLNLLKHIKKDNSAIYSVVFMNSSIYVQI